jgi:hypothetical protein
MLIEDGTLRHLFWIHFEYQPNGHSIQRDFADFHVNEVQYAADEAQLIRKNFLNQLFTRFRNCSKFGGFFGTIRPLLRQITRVIEIYSTKKE